MRASCLAEAGQAAKPLLPAAEVLVLPAQGQAGLRVQAGLRGQAGLPPHLHSCVPLTVFKSQDVMLMKDS